MNTFIQDNLFSIPMISSVPSSSLLMKRKNNNASWQQKNQITDEIETALMINKNEQNSINLISLLDDSQEQKKKSHEGQVVQKQKNPFRLLKVQRRATYQDIITKQISFHEIFMLAGDFTVDRKVFCKIESNELEPYCPLAKYRPQVCVETGKNYIISILNISHTGSTNIDTPIAMLKSISNQKASDLAKFLSIYKEQVKQIIITKQNLAPFMSKPEIREKIYFNHEESMKIARKSMEEAGKDKIYIFGYMKFDVESFTNKFYFIGGNQKFTEVFIGLKDMCVMRHYVQRFGFPGYNDCNGNVNVLYTKFLSKNNYNANLGTFDEETLPYEAERNFIPLPQVEVAPGLFVGDKFEMRELKMASATLKRLDSDRNKNQSIETYLKIEDLNYTLEAEQFISKYYKRKNNQFKIYNINYQLYSSKYQTDINGLNSLDDQEEFGN